MKKKLLYLFSISLGLLSLSNNSFGQTASAKWSLLTDQTVVVSGDVTAVDQTLGSTIVGTQFGSTYGSSGSEHNSGFQRVGNSPGLPQNSPDLTNGYVDYKITPAAGKDLKIQSVAFAAVGGGSGLVRIVAKYSNDGGATFSDMPVSATYNSTNYAATVSEPIVLINGGSGSADFAGTEIATFSGLSIIVPNTKTFILRMFPYTAGSSNKYLANKDITISGITGAPGTLPLNFISFTAKPDAFGKTVSLAWATANEVNTKNFEIQKRTDATEFTTIGTLASKNIAGNYNYSFTDKNATSGNSYYRIVQFDHDDASKSSPIVPVNIKTDSQLSIYPNPVADVLNVNHTASSNNTTLKVLNLNGKVVSQKSVTAGSTSSNVDVSSLAPGAYMLVVDGASVKFVKK